MPRCVNSMTGWGGVKHTLLAAREAGTVLLGSSRLGAVGGGLGSRGGLLGDGLYGRLGDIGVVLGVTWGQSVNIYPRQVKRGRESCGRMNIGGKEVPRSSKRFCAEDEIN